MLELKRILCPVDFSEGARAALETALYFAEHFGAKVDVVHTWELHHHVRPDLSVWMDPSATQPLSTVLEQETQAEMDALLARLEASDNARITSRIIQGPAAATIVELARQEAYDLIVMGTHGRTGLAHLALGSVAERVVRHAPCPVLTIRHPSAD